MREIRIFIPAGERAALNEWLNNPMFYADEDFLSVPAFSVGDSGQLIPAYYTRHFHNISDAAFVWLKDFENYFPNLVIMESEGLPEYEFMESSLASLGLTFRKQNL